MHRLLNWLVIMASLGFAAQQNPYSVIDSMLQSNIINEPYNESSATQYYTTLQKSGSWSDINYSIDTAVGNTWQPIAHLDRLRMIAVAYHKKSSSLYSKADVIGKIQTALSFYVDKNLQCKNNGWIREIQEGLALSKIMVLVHSDVSKDLLNAWSARFSFKQFSFTGANGMWYSAIQLHRDISLQDTLAVSRDRDQLMHLLVAVDTGEGIYADNSFSQHPLNRHFLYNGAYGDAFTQIMCPYWNVFEFAKLPFGDSYTQILVDFMLDGQVAMTWGKLWDPIVSGRNIAHYPNLNANTLINELQKLSISQYRTGDINRSLAWLRGEKSEAPFHYQNHLWWNASYMVQISSHWKISVKANKKDETGFESLHGANAHGYFLHSLTHWVKVHGQEYANIWPLFDWNCIPGSTNDNIDTMPLPENGWNRKNGQTQFVGGVSDGHSSVFAVDYSVSAINSHETCFTGDYGLVCLLDSLRFMKKTDVHTCVEQKKQRGSVQTLQNNQVQGLANELVTSPRWIWHDSVAYGFWGVDSIRVTTSKRSALWNTIDPTNSSTASETDSIFQVSIPLGKRSLPKRFAYAIVPGVSAQSMVQLGAKTPWTIESNDQNVQAISVGSKISAAFFKAGSMNLKSGYQISASAPCTAMFSIGKDSLTVYVADPMWQQSNIIVGIGQKNEELQNISIDLSAKPNLGKSVSKTVPLSALVKRTHQFY